MHEDGCPGKDCTVAYMITISFRTESQFPYDQTAVPCKPEYSDSNFDCMLVNYCAGCWDENSDFVRTYNPSKLLHAILQSLPSEKCIAVMEGIQTDANHYRV